MAMKPVKQMNPERKELILKFIDEFKIKSEKDIEDFQGYVLTDTAENA